VPNPGPEWPTVVAALIDGVDVVVAAVPGPVSASIASRLAARARQRGCVLVAFGRWGGADVTLQVARSMWEGLGAGHGRLRRREVTIAARGRGAAARPRELTVWMPGVTATPSLDPAPAHPAATRPAEPFPALTPVPSPETPAPVPSPEIPAPAAAARAGAGLKSVPAFDVPARAADEVAGQAERAPVVAGRGRGRLVPVDSSAAAAPNRAAGGRKSSSAAVGFNRAAGGRDSSSAAAAPTATVPDLTAKRAAEGREPADSAVTGQVGWRSGRRPRRSRGALYPVRPA
jgi:hypothetical protein